MWAAGRLFVPVNKFDQQDCNSDTAETVKQSVPAMLEQGVLNSDRVYPGSARHVHANRARNEISQVGMLSDREGWVKDFAKLAFGITRKQRISRVWMMSGETPIKSGAVHCLISSLPKLSRRTC